MKRDRSGFTLIELLVVIAIIAILAAILFPVFAAAREKARATACVNNEKQLGLGMLQYVQDYDECPPCGIGASFTNPPTCGSWTTNGYGWAGQIYPYVKSAPVFTCPDDKYAGQTNMYVWPTGSPNVYGGTEVTYAFNPMLVEAGTNACPPLLANISKLNSPGVTLCIMEVNTYRWVVA